MLKANYHTHTELCGHAVGKVMDYVNQAIKLGFTKLGISDHAHIPESFMTENEYKHNYLDESMTSDEFEKIYVKEVIKAKQNPNIKIFLGLETEYLPEFHNYFADLRKKVEYLNLGIHFFNYNGVNYSTYDPLNSELILGYTDTAIKAMETGLYKIFVHPDLFMINYYSRDEHRVFDETCKYCSQKIINTAITNDVYLEINAGGIKNGIKKINGKSEYLYPRTEFWTLVSYTKAKVIIGIDAHDPSDFEGQAVLKAKQFASQFDLNLCDFVKF